jgi:hypothetical protein
VGWIHELKLAVNNRDLHFSKDAKQTEQFFFGASGIKFRIRMFGPGVGSDAEAVDEFFVRRFFVRNSTTA